MEIEKVIMTGMVFKGEKGNDPKGKPKVKTKAKKKAYITGAHGSGAAKMKADIRKKRANRK
ncbi:MAG: hypothetical protein LBN06_05100 [Prevotellaceae bacterium]|jgi:hypothetical protein|nr:hypothetical protein [Prevotellaceae bacterium]